MSLSELATKFMDARFLLAVHGILTDGEADKVLKRIEKYAEQNDLESKPAWMKEKDA